MSVGVGYCDLPASETKRKTYPEHAAQCLRSHLEMARIYAQDLIDQGYTVWLEKSPSMNFDPSPSIFFLDKVKVKISKTTTETL